ncbi:MAG TPA: phosphate ABC transporter permease subunit PstC [Chitinophagales bacterium]|nr:phosphate ABC transporter permease subunit PstC [Chitinophagales bacterium]
MSESFRRFVEKVIESILMLSSWVTTITVLLIIIFLFSEGVSLFRESPLEKGDVILVNHRNPITRLKAEQIKNIYDQNITHWNEIGGTNDSIILLTINELSVYFSDEELGANFEFLPRKLDSLIDANPGIIAIMPEKFVDKNFSGNKVSIANNNIPDFLTGHLWFPSARPAAQLGMLPLLLGTLLVSFGAIAIALPVGLATAIYMAEVAGEGTRRFLKPMIELLAGIPSVVYGFFGLIIIVPNIQQLFNLPVGETALAGSIVLGIMALPTIITVSEDAMRNTPRAMKDASFALGANKFQTIMRVILPHSISGITAAAILGIGRAMGETMAVLMVTGNAAVIPHSILQPVRTIPATIAAELGEASQGGVHFKALFALGCILFIITMIVNLTVEFISSRNKNVT